MNLLLIIAIVILSSIALGAIGLIILFVSCDRAAERERLKLKKKKEQQYH